MSWRKAGVSVGVVLALSWVVGSVGVRIARVTPNPEGAVGPEAQRLDLVTVDGHRIAATFWPGASPDAPCILLVPGIGALHRRLISNAEWFHAKGYHVLAIDLRGHGASSPALHSFGWYESSDVSAAVRWLRAQRPRSKIAIIGISMGGSAALVGPDGPVPADALVLQAVFSDLRQAVFSRVALVFGPWLAPLIEPFLSFQSRLRFGQWPSRIAPLAALRDVTCPVLIIGGARDPFVPLKILDAFHHTAADSRGVWIAPDLGHNGIANTLSEAYRDRVLAFLQECFGP